MCPLSSCAASRGPSGRVRAWWRRRHGLGGLSPGALILVVGLGDDHHLDNPVGAAGGAGQRRLTAHLNNSGLAHGGLAQVSAPNAPCGVCSPSTGPGHCMYDRSQRSASLTQDLVGADRQRPVRPSPEDESQLQPVGADLASQRVAALRARPAAVPEASAPASRSPSAASRCSIRATSPHSATAKPSCCPTTASGPATADAATSSRTSCPRTVRTGEPARPETCRWS